MVTLQRTKKIMIGTGILTGIMYIIVMFIINPLIDNKLGLEVIKLQLAYTTENGKTIINNWHKIGQQNFLKYIYTDYLYALTYALFLSTLYLHKILKNNIKIIRKHYIILTLPFIAGLFDMVENTIEIFFIKDPNDFPASLFAFHSILSSIKWLLLPIMIYYLLKRINTAIT